MILKAHKYRLLPTLEQSDLIDKTIGCSRKVYNLLLDYNTTQYKETKQSIFPEVTYFKSQEEFDYLNEVDSLALANAKQNVQTAFKNFFLSLKNKRQGKKSRFPKFKSKKNSKLSYTTNNVNNSVRIEEIGERPFIKIPKLGFVNLVYHRPLEGRIKSVTITKNYVGHYEISVLTETEEIIKKNKIYDLNNLKVVGVDMSFHDFAVLSTGEKTNHPRWYRVSEKILKRRQRQLSKKVIGSNNRNKSKDALKRLSMHVSDQRKDYLHKLSRRLIHEYDVIVLEDINMQSMSKRMNLGKSVNDLGFGQFRNMLDYKAKLYDSHVYKADKFFPSSQLCSVCGFQNPALKDVAIRHWVCPHCGSEHDRDINAAQNLQNYFKNKLNKNTEGTSGIYACGDKTSTLSLLIGQVMSEKQEAPALTRG